MIVTLTAKLGMIPGAHFQPESDATEMDDSDTAILSPQMEVQIVDIQSDACTPPDRELEKTELRASIDCEDEEMVFDILEELLDTLVKEEEEYNDPIAGGNRPVNPIEQKDGSQSDQMRSSNDVIKTESPAAIDRERLEQTDNVATTGQSEFMQMKMEPNDQETAPVSDQAEAYGVDSPRSASDKGSEEDVSSADSDDPMLEATELTSLELAGVPT